MNKRREKKANRNEQRGNDLLRKSIRVTNRQQRLVKEAQQPTPPRTAQIIEPPMPFRPLTYEDIQYLRQASGFN